MAVIPSLSTKLPWDMANTKWAQSLNPLLANPICNGILLEGIKVTTGTNVINHKLQRELQGYIVVRNSANVTFYDNQQNNQKPELTLLLIASGAATITLYVF